jgi:hypothetical protein
MTPVREKWMWVQLFKLGCLISPLLVLTSALCAEDAEIRLHAIETIHVPSLRAEFVISPIKCDEDGNLFSRSPDAAGLEGGVILKIARNGDKETRFETGSIPELHAPRLIDFSPAGSGQDLFVLVKTEKEGENSHYIVRFDGDGKYQAKYLVPASVRVQRIAVFPNGEFFVTGRKLATGPSHIAMNSDPFVGIFDPATDVVREIRLKNDVKAKGKQNKETLADRAYESSLTMSSAMLGGDGNVYLTRRTPTGPVFAISPGGRPLRTIHLVPPNGSQLHSVQVAARELAAEYRKIGSDGSTVLAVLLQLFDLRTGRKTSGFLAPNSLGTFGCYLGGKEFVFLDTEDDDKLNIIHAAPE